MLKNILIFCSVLFFCSYFLPPHVIPAEFDSEFEEVESEYIPPEKTVALLEISLTSTTGNSDTVSIFSGAEFLHASSGNSIGFDGNFYYGESSRGLNVRIVEGILKGAHDFNPNNYGYVMGTLKHNEFQRLNLRTSLGIGYGHRLVIGSAEELSLEGGIGLQSEDFSGARKDDYYQEGRIGINYIYRFSKTARFVTRGDFLPSLSEISNHRLRGEGKLIESLYKDLALILNLVLDYDGSPVEGGVKNFDTKIFAGVGYNFF